jgi:sporulation protein YlmC with PRC-barrel domain
MHLVSEVLDEQIKDRDGENAGRVDGIVLELRDGKPPRVTYIEVSPITLLSRFSMRLAMWYARFDRRLGKGRGVPFRIPWSRVRREGPTLVIDLDVEATPINALEDWLRRTIVGRIPGNQR